MWWAIILFPTTNRNKELISTHFKIDIFIVYLNRYDNCQSKLTLSDHETEVTVSSSPDKSHSRVTWGGHNRNEVSAFISNMASLLYTYKSSTDNTYNQWIICTDFLKVVNDKLGAGDLETVGDMLAWYPTYLLYRNFNQDYLSHESMKSSNQTTHVYKDIVRGLTKLGVQSQLKREWMQDACLTV